MSGSSTPSNPGFESTVERDPAGSGQFHARKGGETEAPIGENPWTRDLTGDIRSYATRNDVRTDRAGHPTTDTIFDGASDVVIRGDLNGNYLARANFDKAQYVDAISRHLDINLSDPRDRIFLQSWFEANANEIERFLRSKGVGGNGDLWGRASLYAESTFTGTPTWDAAKDVLAEADSAAYLRDSVDDGRFVTELLEYVSENGFDQNFIPSQDVFDNIYRLDRDGEAVTIKDEFAAAELDPTKVWTLVPVGDRTKITAGFRPGADGYVTTRYSWDHETANGWLR
ncbi:hypothetical protein [Leifsonia sp. Leaf264]|uniref:hypothetical protein n=1 Tax=Leifsonia sp. Leaf264 TaxID=1736314 RepID=UPI0007007641|nr:hypothetical protein [Leifsonia sp. Leaf264]KQO98170.1 hypothetical protein ASF30_08910 [Leifsonia sp. Leaf264]